MTIYQEPDTAVDPIVDLERAANQAAAYQQDVGANLATYAHQPVIVVEASAERVLTGDGIELLATATGWHGRRYAGPTGQLGAARRLSTARSGE